MPQKRVRFKEDELKGNNLHVVEPRYAFLVLLFVVLCGVVTNYSSKHLPPALTAKDLERHPGSFIAERAWENTKALNNFGPKPVGSSANEELAFGYLQKELSTINATKHANQEVVIDTQVVTGAYSISILNSSLTSMYRNVQNLVVKLVGHQEKSTRDALLLNCHFDSVASSPGASDDGASCAVMLEVLRVLSRQAARHEYSIIFLFNGAEETLLQAAHGFITQHPWATDVKAFLNLESSGSGGKEVLFQSGPHHPWMIEVYARAIRYPYAHAVGEEIFQLGLIPSETDFRMFRDYGEVPGMDFAHIINGYRYHTKYDSIDYLSLPVLQRTGDNILALTREFANCEELATQEASVGKTVFFDFLGLFFVHYSVERAKLINIAVSLLALLVPLLGLFQSIGRNGFKEILYEAFFGFLGAIVGASVSVMTCTTMARQLDFFDKAMTWYTNTYLILGLYCCPALLGHSFVQMLFNTFWRDKKSILSLGVATQARLIGVNLFWGLLTVSITAAGYRSSYIFLPLLFFSLLSSTVIVIFRLQQTIRKWIAVHLFFQTFVMLWATNFYNVFLELFVPITGRSGGQRNPEILIGFVAAFGTLLACSYLLPLMGLLKRSMGFTAQLSAITVLTVILACFTSVGFPYRDDSNGNPTPQRHFVTHTFRVFHDNIGLLRYTDSGYFIQETDRNSIRTIESIIGQEELTPVKQMQSCGEGIFCALPYFSLWHQIRFNNYWTPAPIPVTNNMVTMGYMGKEQLDDYTQRFTFTMEGSIQSSIIIGPKPGVTLVNWSLLDHVPPPTKFQGRDAHFVFITHGLPGKAWNVTIDLQTNTKHHDDLLVDITVVTKFWEYHDMHTEEFEELLAKFPSWAHVVPSVAQVSVFPL